MKVPAKPIPQNETIAERELRVANSTDTVLVQLGKPYYVSPNEAVCPYRFVYRDMVGGMDISGSDAFQALRLAMRTVPVELQHSSYLPVGQMYLFEVGDGMGFMPEDGWS
jgi:hypothetical protein